MERSDLLKANAGIFKVQGKALSDYSSKNVKVCTKEICVTSGKVLSEVVKIFELISYR